jgi:hypothetical protein
LFLFLIDLISGVISGLKRRSCGTILLTIKANITKNTIIIESETTIDMGLKRYSVILTAIPSNTDMATLITTLNVNRSIPVMSRPGKNTAIKAYPGRNSNNTSANGILSGIWSKGGIRIKTKAKNVVIRTK